jgi:hypothetical protein
MNKYQVSGLITPMYPSDQYPIIDPLYGIDGLRCVTSSNVMYNIPLEKRRGGMVVGVVGSSSVNYWSLLPENAGLTWSLGNINNNEWISLFAGVNVQSVYPIINKLENVSVTVPLNYEYIVYGDLELSTNGTFSNSGRVVIINGGLSFSGGTYSGFTPTYVTLSTVSKYSASFSAATGEILVITHSLGTSDITYTVRDSLNYVFPNVELIDNNSIRLTTTGTISNGRINIIG